MLDDNKFNHELAANLRAARARAGQRQCSVAEAVGVSTPTFANWEKGRMSPTLAHLNKLARAYGVSLDSLIPAD